MTILAGGDLDFSYENGIAHLHLNRPKKANSTTLLAPLIMATEKSGRFNT